MLMMMMMMKMMIKNGGGGVDGDGQDGCEDGGDDQLPYLLACASTRPSLLAAMQW